MPINFVLTQKALFFSNFLLKRQKLNVNFLLNFRYFLSRLTYFKIIYLTCHILASQNSNMYFILKHKDFGNAVRVLLPGLISYTLFDC